jgi:hypothetical protein
VQNSSFTNTTGDAYQGMVMGPHMPTTSELSSLTQKGWAGIYAGNVPALSIGSANPSSLSRNNFSNLDNGIVAYGSTLIVDRSNFMFSITRHKSGGYQNAIDGNGIFVDSSTLIQRGCGRYVDTILGLAYNFVNVDSAITGNRSNLNIRDNAMSRVISGVRALSGNLSRLYIVNNTMDSVVRRGIKVTAYKNPFRILIDSNYIINNSAANTSFTGVEISGVINNPNKKDSFQVQRNVIRVLGGVNNTGMLINSCSNGTSVLKNKVLLGSIQNYAGIIYQNSPQIFSSQNIVSGVGTSGSSSFAYPVGIWVQGSRDTLQCDSVASTYVGIRYSGSCALSSISSCKFNNHTDGLYISPSAVISPPQKFKLNGWYGSYVRSGGRSQGNAQFIVNTTSLPLKPTSLPSGWITYIPCSNCPNSPNCISYSPSRLSALSDIDNQVINDELVYEDVYQETQQWENEKAVFQQLNENPDLHLPGSEEDSFFILRKDLPLGKISEINDSIVMLYQLDDNIFKENISALKDSMQNIDIQMGLLNDSLSLDLDSLALIELQSQLYTLDSFRQSISQAYDQLKQDFEDFQNNKIEDIIDLNDNLVANQKAESNYKNTTEIYLKTIALENYSFDEEYIEKINAIASQCPLIGGNAVFTARSIQALWGDYSYDDDSICAKESMFFKMTPQDVTKTKHASKMKMYPNPAQEMVYLKYVPNQEKEYKLLIFDMLGRKVSDMNVRFTQSVIEYDVRGLSNGIYAVKVIDDGGQIFSEKLNIQR